MDDARRDGEVIAAASEGEALPVVSLIDLIEGGDRPSGQSEPPSQRGADLAACATELQAVRGHLPLESAAELFGTLPPGPVGEPPRLCRDLGRIAEIEKLELPLKSDVVVEHVGEQRGVGGAAERPQE
jgi:hypothetical protein